MQIIENWTDITGSVLATDDSLDKYVVLDILLKEVREVDDFPNLVRATKGDVIRVHIPGKFQHIKIPEETDRIDCRVRRATPKKLIVHRDHFINLSSASSDHENPA